MAVDLEHRAADLLEEFRLWQRLSDRFAPDLPRPGRTVEVAFTGHLPAQREPVEDPVDEPVRWAVPGVWDDEPAPAPVVLSVGELVAQVEALVGQLLAVGPSALPAGQALGECEALARISHQLRLAVLARSQDVKDRALFEQLGYRSVSAWQRTIAPDTPGGDGTLARRLGDAPHLAAALTAGSVSFSTATLLGKALNQVRTVLDRPDGLIDGQPGEPVITAIGGNVITLLGQDRGGLSSDPAVDSAQAALLAQLQTDVQQILSCGASQRERLEQLLVLFARHATSPATVKAGLAEIIDQLLPSRLEQRNRTAHDKRALALSLSQDGSWHLEATLTPEVGEQLFTALAAEARRDPANPLDTHAREQARAAAAEAAGQDGWIASQDRPEWETRALRDNGEAFTPDADQLVPRSRSKRLHDALGRLLTRYLEGGLGGVSGKVPVQLTATLSEQLITGAPGAPPARGASGQRLPRSLLHRWWCDAHVTVLLMSHGFTPLGVVHRGRTLTGVERTAALAQYGNRCPGIGCCPGTPDPLIPLVPHHIQTYASTGQTSLQQTLPCCPVLHDDIHLGKRTIRLRDGRYISEDGYLHEA